MESIAQSAVAGLIAALTATALLGLASLVRQRWARCQDVRFIRKLLVGGGKRVMEAEDTCHQGMNTTSSGDALRAAQYNNMTKRLGIALEMWVVNLSHTQRMEVFDAWTGITPIHCLPSKRMGKQYLLILIFLMEDGLQRK